MGYISTIIIIAHAVPARPPTTACHKTVECIFADFVVSNVVGQFCVAAYCFVHFPGALVNDDPVANKDVTD